MIRLIDFLCFNATFSNISATNTNTKYFIANHSAQDEQNNDNKFSYNDWNDLHMIHDSYKKEKRKNILHIY